MSVGFPGSFIVNGGALGTPSSGDASNLLNLPAGNLIGTIPSTVHGGTGLTSAVLNVSGGGTVATPVPTQNVNVFAQGNITQWNVTLPSAPYDGEVVGVGCPGGVVTTIAILAAATITPGGPTSCNRSAGPFAWYQFSQQVSEWILVFNIANTGGGGSVLAGRTTLSAGTAVVTGAFTGTCVTQDVTNPANVSYGVEALTSLTLFGTGTDVIKWICS